MANKTNKTCRGKVAGKKSCLFTRASKATKELVKEKLVVCARFKRCELIESREPLTVSRVNTKSGTFSFRFT